MPCLLALLALLFPRIVLLIVYFTTDFLDKAYETILWPLLGFIFMPLTTLAYAWAVNIAGSVYGIYLAAVVVAVLLDLGLLGGSSRSRRRVKD